MSKNKKSKPEEPYIELDDPPVDEDDCGECEDEEALDSGGEWIKEGKWIEGAAPVGTSAPEDVAFVLKKDARIKRIEVPEEERAQPELPSGPTCKFFAPASSLADPLGAGASENWPYDTLFAVHGCSHPTRNRVGRLTCDAYDRQEMCQYYQQEDAMLLAGKRGNVADILMRQRRVGFGTFEYDVIAREGEDEEVLHSFNNLQEEGKGRAKASAAYLSELTQREMLDAPDVELDSEQPSYLQMLVAEHG